jgi:hypothetical protein
MNNEISSNGMLVSKEKNNYKDNFNIKYFYWNLHPERNMKRYIFIKNNMYLVDSIGGGFASIKNTSMAYQFLILLYKLAQMINDKETIIKCNIYYGYTLLWGNKYKIALYILNEQKKIAHNEGYQNLVYRCDSGLERVWALSSSLHSRLSGPHSLKN